MAFVTNEDDALEAINSCVKAVLIVNGPEGEMLMHRIGEGQELTNLYSIIVYAQNPEKE